MGNKATCSLCTVCEHDMDILIMQAMLSDSGFLKLFLSKTDLPASNLTPVHAEISNTDTDLGETDITVILSSGTDIYALLIEDKIDAVAQKEQHGVLEGCGGTDDFSSRRKQTQNQTHFFTFDFAFAFRYNTSNK